MMEQFVLKILLGPENEMLPQRGGLFAVLNSCWQHIIFVVGNGHLDSYVCLRYTGYNWHCLEGWHCSVSGSLSETLARVSWLVFIYCLKHCTEFGAVIIQTLLKRTQRLINWVCRDLTSSCPFRNSFSNSKTRVRGIDFISTNSLKHFMCLCTCSSRVL